MLGLLLAGSDPGSEIYVRNKIRQSEGLGIGTALERLPASAAFAEALAVVDVFNADPEVDGILVQSPLPSGMGDDAERRIFEAIDPSKDVDGFHPENVGRLVQRTPTLAPCTPSGVMELLDRSAVEIEGRQAVVIGRSDIVGKPMAMLLLHRHATVTICHSRTVDLPRVASRADVLVAAVGRPAIVTTDFVKPGATVVDVGTNTLTDRDRVVSLFGTGFEEARRVRQEGPGAVRRRASRRRGRCGRRVAGAGGRGPAHHRDAVVEYRAGGRAASAAAMLTCAGSPGRPGISRA